MMTLDGMKFMVLVALPIISLACIPCGYIYVKFFEKKPLLSIIIWVIIFIVFLYAIYFLRGYLSDLGWLPYPSTDDMTNLTMGLSAP